MRNRDNKKKQRQQQDNNKRRATFTKSDARLEKKIRKATS